MKNNLGFSPLLSLKNNITLSSSKFTQFICPCIISPTQLKIHHTSFSRFLSQIITSSHSFLNKDALISCSSFRDITTSSKGSIFSYSNAHVHVDRCSFINVASTSFPACFYVENSTTIVTRCTFSSCYAIGGESCYGNAYYCYQSSCTVSFSHTESCAPMKAQTGDSTIALRKSTMIDINFLNSSNSFGNSGAASITFRESQCEQINVHYLTVTNAHEYCAIEMSATKITNIFYANFINSTSCDQDVIHNNGVDGVYVSHGVFINPHDSISFDPNTIHFEDCYSNNVQGCTSCTLCDSEARAEINVIFVKPPLCGTCVIQFHINRKMIRNTIFVFLYCVKN